MMEEPPRKPKTKVMMLATGLAFSSLILVPAVAVTMGMSSTLTGALRIGLMRASFRVLSPKRKAGDDAVATDICCH
jgi:hypothetical protein